LVASKPPPTFFTVPCFRTSLPPFSFFPNPGAQVQFLWVCSLTFLFDHAFPSAAPPPPFPCFFFPQEFFVLLRTLRFRFSNVPYPLFFLKKLPFFFTCSGLDLFPLFPSPLRRPSFFFFLLFAYDLPPPPFCFGAPTGFLFFGQVLPLPFFLKVFFLLLVWPVALFCFGLVFC